MAEYMQAGDVGMWLRDANGDRVDAGGDVVACRGAELVAWVRENGPMVDAESMRAARFTDRDALEAWEAGLVTLYGDGYRGLGIADPETGKEYGYLAAR